MSPSYTWAGTDSLDPNNWDDPNDWLVGGALATAPPGASDDVTISATTTAATINGTGYYQSSTLTLSAATGEAVNLTGYFSTGSLGLTGLLQLQGTLSDGGSATFAAGAELIGGMATVSGPAIFGSTFTVQNAELDLATTSTATLSTLTLVGATTFSGNITIGTVSDFGATSLMLGTGTFDVTSSTPSVPAVLPTLTIQGNDNLVGAFTTSSLTVVGGDTDF